MKVIILAGGLGTRLGNRTESVPKPMVEIGGRPVIWHIMKIFAHFGYSDFIISLGYKAHVIKEYFRNYDIYTSDFSINIKKKEVHILDGSRNEDWNVSLIDTGLATLKGARIKRLEQYLDEVNMVTYGDGVADIDIQALVNYHKSHGKMVTVTGVHPPARFGEIIEKENNIIAFEEKPQTSQGLINGGFMVFNRTLLDHLTPDENCDFEKGPLENLAKKGEVRVFKHLGNWECMDHERDVVYLNTLWKKNKAFWKIWNN